MALFGAFCEAIEEAGKLQQSSFAQNYALGQAQQSAFEWQRIALRNKARAESAESEAENLRRDYNNLTKEFNRLLKLAQSKGIVKIV